MEFFSKTNHKLDAKKNKLTATGFLRGSSFRQNGFGNIPIKSTNKESHIWKFKICRNKHEYGITLGIIEDGHLDLDGKFTSKGFGYGLNSDGDIYSANSKDEYYKLKNIKQQFKTGDIVIMRLDLIKKCLSFIINDENDQLIKIKKIKSNKKIGYKMAVYLYYEGDSVELIDYFKEKEKKEKKQKEKTKEVRLKRALTDIHQIKHNEIEEKQNDDKIVDLLKNEITEKNIEIKILKQKLDEITQQESKEENKILILQKENEILRNDRDETQKINLNQQKQIQSLNSKMDEYKIKMKEFDKLKIENEILMEEEKELKLENEKLKKENKELKLKNLDSTKYKNWSWHEIIEWILLIEDGRFMKYDNILRDILSEEEPIGLDLEEVNEGDIKRWGIKNFRDIKVLCQYIKKLVNKNNNNNNEIKEKLTNNNIDDNDDNDDEDNNKNEKIAVANSEGHETGGHYR